MHLKRYTRNKNVRNKKKRKKKPAESNPEEKIPNTKKKKKEVQWLDKVDSFQSSYNTDLKHISSLWNAITEKQMDHINSFTQKLDSMDDSYKCVVFDNETVSKRGIQSLLPKKWVSDEVVNMYCKLLWKRDKQLVLSQLHSNHNVFMHTNFYTLLQNNVSNENYWKKKQEQVGMNLFEVNKIFIPIHINQNHWIMVVVSMNLKIIEGYDSMLKTNDPNGDIVIAMKKIKIFLEEQHEKKYNSSLSSCWSIINRSGSIPSQENGTDCGIFMMAYMDMLSVGDDFNFDQKNIDHFRQRMKFSIITQSCMI